MRNFPLELVFVVLLVAFFAAYLFNPSTSKSNQSRFQFSLYTLLVVMTVVAIAFGVIVFAARK